MKRISLILAGLMILGVSSTASAAKGGPFDNGDYSVLLDNSGIYQAALRFKNGSGFAQFGTNVDLTLFVDISNSSGTTQRGSTYSVLNRSLIYYKGVTFLGTATGIVDHERKVITGVTNGNSDVLTSGQTNSSNNNNTQSVTAATTTLLNNAGVGYPCNTHWRADITQTKPILKFKGTGELTVINPSLQQTAYQALQQLISNYTPSPLITLGQQIEDLADGLQEANTQANLFLSTLQTTKDNSDSVKMTVFGSRVFFVARR